MPRCNPLRHAYTFSFEDTDYMRTPGVITSQVRCVVAYNIAHARHLLCVRHPDANHVRLLDIDGKPQ